MRAQRLAPFVMLFAVGLAFDAESIKAQAVWTDKFTARGVTIDYLKSFFEDESISGATSITFLSGRFPITNRLRLKPQIPIGYASTNRRGVSSHETVLGNPYLGLEALGNDGTSTAEIGLRFPAIYGETSLTRIARATDFDRFEAFSEDAAALTGSFVGRNASGNVRMDVAGGATVLIPFDDRETDIYGQYAVQIVIKESHVGAITGITGRILFTEGGLSFGQRTTHQAGFSLIGYFGNFRPGIMARLALDEPLRKSIDAVLGFNFSYELR